MFLVCSFQNEINLRTQISEKMDRQSSLKELNFLRIVDRNEFLSKTILEYSRLKKI